MKAYMKTLIVVLSVILALIVLWFAIGIIVESGKIKGGDKLIYMKNPQGLANNTIDINGDNSIAKIAVHNASTITEIAGIETPDGIEINNNPSIGKIMRTRVEDIFIYMCALASFNSMFHNTNINNNQNIIAQRIANIGNNNIFIPEIYVMLRFLYENDLFIGAKHNYKLYKNLLENRNKPFILAFTYLDTIYNVSISNRTLTNINNTCQINNNEFSTSLQNLNQHITNFGNCVYANFIYYADKVDINNVLSMNPDIFLGYFINQGTYCRKVIDNKYSYTINVIGNNTISLTGGDCEDADGLFWYEAPNHNTNILHDIEIDESDGIGKISYNNCKYHKLECIYTVNPLIPYNPANCGNFAIRNGHLVKSILNLFSACYYLRYQNQPFNIRIYLRNNPILELIVNTIVINK